MIGEHRPGGGAGDRDLQPGDGLRTHSDADGDPEFGDAGGWVDGTVRQRDEGVVRSGQFHGPHGDQSQRLDRVGATEQFHGDLAGGFQPSLSPAHLFVQPGVVDRDAGGGGQCVHHHLVVIVERLPVQFLRQIQPSEHLTAGPDRHSQECCHRRVVGR